jgi:hypothetical protein
MKLHAVPENLLERITDLLRFPLTKGKGVLYALFISRLMDLLG